MPPLKNAVSRIPVESEGLQVNFCKKPVCPNFGRPASTDRQLRGVQQNPQDPYVVSGAADNLFIKCTRCGEFPPIKSNLAIREEIERMADYLRPALEPACPNSACDNRLTGISTPQGVSILRQNQIRITALSLPSVQYDIRGIEQSGLSPEDG